jgi:hypothetical protein
MKTMILGLMVLVSASSWAKSSDDFHSLIVESAEARKTLSQKLRKSVDLVDAAKLAEKQREERVVLSETENQIENVAVPSRPLRSSVSNRAQNKANSKIDRENMQRLSQEFEEAR